MAELEVDDEREVEVLEDVELDVVVVGVKLDEELDVKLDEELDSNEVIGTIILVIVDPDEVTGGRVVVIGDSFGGRVVDEATEDAVGPTIIIAEFELIFFDVTLHHTIAIASNKLKGCVVGLTCQILKSSLEISIKIQYLSLSKMQIFLLQMP